jgi:hypothetical protein
MSESTAVVTWADKLAKYAVEQAQTEEVGGSSNWLRVKSTVLWYGEKSVEGNKLDVIVADSVHENQYYDPAFPYDPNETRSPICFAFGDTEDEMEADPESEKPQGVPLVLSPENVRLSGGCKDCARNQWPKDRKGGKECKNVRRLALLPAQPLSAEYLSKVDPAWLKISVTSVKGWSSYVQAVGAQYKRPVWSVITQISTVPDPKGKAPFLLTFQAVGLLPEELIGIAEARHLGVQNQILFPYRKNAEAPAQGPAKF